MRDNYIYQTKSFWGILLVVYAGILSITHVQIYQNHYYGVVSGVMEPVWHLVLRNLKIIDGGKFNQYGSSLKPILYQLPYVLALYCVATMIIIAALYCLQKGLNTLRHKGAT